MNKLKVSGCFQFPTSAKFLADNQKKKKKKTTPSPKKKKKPKQNKIEKQPANTLSRNYQNS